MNAPTRSAPDKQLLKEDNILNGISTLNDYFRLQELTENLFIDIIATFFDAVEMQL